VESNYDLSSDHTPVITSMSTVIINKSHSPWLTSRNTDWTAFKCNLQENIDLNQRIKSPEDLNAPAQYFITLVQKAAWQSTPQTESKPTTTIDAPLHIRQLIAEKRRARRIWQRTRNNND
jgi:hypothetical protein